MVAPVVQRQTKPDTDTGGEKKEYCENNLFRNPIVRGYSPLSDGWVACSLIGGPECTGFLGRPAQPIMRH